MSATAGQELLFDGPAALAERVRAKQLSPRELVEASLARIEALNPKLNAFRVTMAEEALATAEAMGDFEAPLAGVPIAVKDDLPVAGQATTWGTRSYPPAHATDSEAVRRLRAAGAIPVGITNVPELMVWPWTASKANGVTRNPWDVSRTPGGSSGGSAAAVAAGMVPCATGSDGGGSIRIPAACCGLVGMKPSRGLVPTAPLREPWLDLSVFGGLARSVRDSAALLDVMAATGTRFADACSRPPQSLRIGISRKIPPGLIASVSDDQRDAFNRMAGLLESLGHRVSERHPSYGTVSLEFTQTWLRGVYEDSLNVPDRSALEPATRQMAAAGRVLVPPRRRAALLRAREKTTRRILALWDEVDVLLTPGLASTAIAAEGGYGRPAPIAFNRAARFTPWTPLFNLTGQPAVSMPAGVGSDGLPLSVQLVGRPGAEDVLYGVAAQLEEAEGFPARRPPI